MAILMKSNSSTAAKFVAHIMIAGRLVGSDVLAGTRRYFGVMLITLIGGLVSIGAFLAVAQWQASVAESSFVDRAKGYEQALNVHLSTVASVLYTLKAYFEVDLASNPRGRI